VTKQSKESSGEQNKHEQAGTLNPGDQAPAGVEGTGENICRDCQGSGRRDDAPCPTCGGTGRVIEGIGGA
jgi:DnaJ-class molecular chaperone